MKSRWFVYILKCRDGTLYTGITTDPDRRLRQHNTGEGGAYTRARRPGKMLFQERHPTRSSALRREAQIKSWNRLRKQKLIHSGAR